MHNLPIFKSKHNFFKNSFSASTISEWNKLDPSLRNSESFLTFKKNILQFIRRTANFVYNCHNIKGIKLITLLRLGLSHLREHKSKHNFFFIYIYKKKKEYQEYLNPLCNCGHDIESTTYFFLHCPLFTNDTLLSTFGNLLNNTDFVLTKTFLFCNLSFNSNKKLEIL